MEPLRTIGSLSLCRTLLEAGLVDRFRVVVFPVITGSTGSERIYDGYPDVALEMVASQTFDGRIQLVEYVPTVLTGPPGGGQTAKDAANAALTGVQSVTVRSGPCPRSVSSGPGTRR